MKIPAEFLPKSWEMPPGARVIEDSASVVARDFDGETLNWLVALVEIPDYEYPFLWMRPLDTRFEAGFVEFTPYFCQMSDLILHTQDHPTNVLSEFSRVCEDNHFARHIFLNAQGQLWDEKDAFSTAILVANNGFAARSIWGHIELNDNTPFRWSEPLDFADFSQRPTSDLVEHVKAALVDPNVDAVFTRHFASLSEQERYSLLFPNDRGEDETIKVLLRNFLLAQDFWDEVPESADLEFVAGPCLISSVRWDNGRDSCELEVLSAQQEEVTKLMNWCRPMNQEVAARPRVNEWLTSNSPKFEVTVSNPPTAHEQLEASVKWREWKANHENFDLVRSHIGRKIACATLKVR